MQWHRGWVIAALACAGWGGVEARAHACTCFGDSTLVAPVSDGHPAGAPLGVASACGGALEGWSVTVDGAPAMLIGGDPWVGIHTVGVAPAPAEGAEVVLTQDCDGYLEIEGCIGDDGSVELARFVIGAQDEQAPPAAQEVIVTHESGTFSIDCDSLTLDLEITANVEFSEREPGAWAVVSFLADGEVVQVEAREIPASGVVEAWLYANERDYEGREICVEATVRDASGNASAVQSDCTAIPETSAASRSSCACTSSATTREPLLMVFVAALLRRRRRISARAS